MKHLKTYKIFESSEEDDYVDSLLDKISKKGIDSLSDSEKNRLNKITSDNIEDRTLRIINGEIYIRDVSHDRFNSPEYKKHIYPKSDIISDANRMFFSEIKKMNIDQIELNSKIYEFEIIEEMSGEHLKIGDYILNPFWEGSKEISINHLNKYYTYPLKYIPIYKNEMVDFIKDFLSKILPEIIE